MMDTHTLQTFLAVARTESFSKAADQLYLTQSAISKRVASLEDQLGSRLFDRIGRRVTLTEAGLALLPRARQVLLELEDARRAISNLTGEVTGTLSLAASHHISLHRLPPVLRNYTARYPKVELDLRFDESEVAYDEVLRGELELALITLSLTPDPAIHAIPIWHDPLHYVVSRDHLLAAERRVTLEQLTEVTAILPSQNTFTRQLVEQLFARHALSLSVAMSTNYLDTIRMMVSIGLGWSLLPQSLIREDLVVLPVESEPVQRQLGVIHHKDRTLSNAARHLIEMLTA